MDGSAEQQRNWGPFGRPIYDHPEAQALSRVGVIDIGSNSVRLVIFDGAARSPAYFFNEKVMCGLGAGMGETGRLNPEGRQRALAAVRRFVTLAEGMGIPTLTAAATAAVRNAEDGPSFCEEIEQSTGLVVYVVSGEEEARLSAQGVLLGWPGAAGLACDIGGSSMELALLDGTGVGPCASTSLGPLRLKTIKGGRKARRAEIDQVLARLTAEIPKHKRLYLVGGSWRAIAKLDMHRRGYPLAVLHDYHMTPAQARKTLDWLKGKDFEVLRREAGLSAARIALVPIAGEVLRRLMKAFGTREIWISAYGIREGMLYEQMSEMIRARDPLIEACHFNEAQSARMPGFGNTLYEFVSPLFRRTRDERRRLIRAACLLHDVSWRAHPDYRGEICFDNATRSNLGGIDHPGRVFVGLALLHRYRNAEPSGHLLEMVERLPEKDRHQAAVLGKAMRFGAMFSANNPDHMGRLDYRSKKRQLRLILPRAAADLYGEVAEARFMSLAAALECETEVRLAGD
ncbi:Ppx/GppA family phosphatase [Vannielia sp.]|uniref:Ppx/GppA family phosphatase n=1 Tax=Vannielia sp. TaxID=2813045 RepID=UPI0026239B6A|nr:Ppx/GppA family phosphatase [Vannielia sp.]MDF1871448.1 Ppx/GppA family phosphatase [Vannielia sp.]